MKRALTAREDGCALGPLFEPVIAFLRNVIDGLCPCTPDAIIVTSRIFVAVRS